MTSLFACSCAISSRRAQFLEVVERLPAQLFVSAGFRMHYSFARRQCCSTCACSLSGFRLGRNHYNAPSGIIRLLGGLGTFVLLSCVHALCVAWEVDPMARTTHHFVQLQFVYCNDSSGVIYVCCPNVNRAISCRISLKGGCRVQNGQ